MFATGKYLKDKAANARRAATTLRTLSEDASLSIADRGVMIAAASIAEALANQSAKLGKERKASEEKYERELIAARQQAKKLLAQLPATSIVEKVAIVSLNSYRLKYLIDELNTDKSPENLRRNLNYWVENTITELANDIASALVSKKHEMAASFEACQENLKLKAASAHVSMIAKRYEQLTQPATESV